MRKLCLCLIFYSRQRNYSVASSLFVLLICSLDSFPFSSLPLPLNHWTSFIDRTRDKNNITSWNSSATAVCCLCICGCECQSVGVWNGEVLAHVIFDIFTRGVNIASEFISGLFNHPPHQIFPFCATPISTKTLEIIIRKSCLCLHCRSLQPIHYSKASARFKCSLC